MKNSPKLLLTLLVLTVPVALGANSPHANHAAKAQESQAAAPRPYTAKTPKLNKTELDAWLAKPGQLLLIDVRRPEEISAIGGFAAYLSIQANSIEQSLASIPKDRAIITVSNHAGRAGKAADLLAAKGFNVVGAVGAQNYEEEGGKLVKIIPPAPKASTEIKPKS